jgi:hypothetical protein
MASRKKGAQILFPLESAEAFQKAVDDSDKFLAVVDVFQSWTGPTSVMEPVFRRIKMEKDKLMVKFYNVDEALLTPEQRKQFVPVAAQGGCKPLFVLIKNRVLVTKIVGANAPQVETEVVDNANLQTADQEE